MSAAISVRVALPSDRAFCSHSWREIVKQRLHDIVRGKYDASTVRVAFDESDPDCIVGFAVHTGPVLHMVYVRKGVRGLGIARALLEPLDIEFYSLTTPDFESRIKPGERGWRFAPREGVIG